MSKSWIPLDWPKCIVSLERPTVDSEGRASFSTIGTGFLVEHQSFVVLVTARHVVENRTDLLVSVNQRSGRVVRRAIGDLQERHQISWHYSPDADLAVMLFAYDWTKDDVKKIPLDLFEEFENISQGDEVFFLGFPLGIGGERILQPVVRMGIVAYKSDDGTFLIDGNVFPGNSGSPVFYRPLPIGWENGEVVLGSVRMPKFIGIIYEAVNYVDTAVSLQTMTPRVYFVENAGLGKAYGVEHLHRLLRCRSLEEEHAKRRSREVSEEE